MFQMQLNQKKLEALEFQAKESEQRERDLQLELEKFRYQEKESERVKEVELARLRLVAEDKLSTSGSIGSFFGQPGLLSVKKNPS